MYSEIQILGVESHASSLRHFPYEPQRDQPHRVFNRLQPSFRRGYPTPLLFDLKQKSISKDVRTLLCFPRPSTLVIVSRGE